VVKIGILKTDDVRESLVDDFGEYPDMFGRIIHDVDSSVEVVEYNVMEFEYPADIDELDGYLITGSKFSVYDDEEWIRRLGAFIQELDVRRKKLIGVCFGHQMVAHFLGGETAKSDAGWLIGVQEHVLNEEGLAFTGADAGFEIICSHQDQVVVPARGSVTLAGSDECPNAMCRIGDHILTVQGHPEFSRAYSERLYGLRREELGDEIVDGGLESLGRPVDSSLFVRWFLSFIG
jgi:GMP synthase-like glutamine amidotransferase